VKASAQRGIRDPNMLRAMTLKEFGLSDESASVARQLTRLGRIASDCV
jgi:hypothetical protein